MPGPQTKGPVHAVPCPSCGFKQDFRELLVTDGETLVPEMDVSCDQCGMMAKVAGVQKITFVALEATGRRAPDFRGPMYPPQQQQPMAGAPQQRPGLIRRMLKR